jgi:hypothetical protein
MKKLIKGSECRMEVSVPRRGQYTPYDFHFEVEYYTSPSKRVVVDKDLCIPMEHEGGDDYKFLVPFDSSLVGVGNVIVEVVMHIPDDIFPDGIRTERKRDKKVVKVIA